MPSVAASTEVAAPEGILNLIPGDKVQKALEPVSWSAREHVLTQIFEDRLTAMGFAISQPEVRCPEWSTEPWTISNQWHIDGFDYVAVWSNHSGTWFVNREDAKQRMKGQDVYGRTYIQELQGLIWTPPDNHLVVFDNRLMYHRRDPYEKPGRWFGRLFLLSMPG